MLLLHLPVPTAPLCPTDAVEAYVAAGDDLQFDPEWSETLDCESEADCLGQLRRLHDPAETVRVVRAENAAQWKSQDPGLVAAYVAGPVLLRAELLCLQSGARATWSCDAASCSLETVRPSAGVTVTAQAWGTVPGTPTLKVETLVSEDVATLRSARSDVLQRAAATAAAQMITVLDHCEAGGCEPGWRTIRAYARTLASPTPPVLVAVDRDLWGANGFSATFLPSGQARPSGITASLDCVDVRGECDMHESTCSLAIRRDDEALATAARDGDEVRWGGAHFALVDLGTRGGAVARTEGRGGRE